MERLSSRKHTLCITFWLSLFLLWLAAPAAAQSWEYVFFKGTQYPLKVVYLQGELPGPTVMVQGGIQGDETSGFVTAQLLSRSKVMRGSLIVLPRANVPSINLRQRQINVDMNRRFDRDYNRFYEDRVARVIRFLLCKSNAFIHLHEGSGFYYPTYIDKLRNPNRYGQSIIVDTLVWQNHAQRINLEDTVNNVLEGLNSGIASRDYQFKLFNTRTFDRGTSYPEMRKSLTCYALAEHNIPAMAVEVSKDIIQIGWKVHRQLQATMMLLHRFGVEVIPPDFTAEDIRAYARKSVSVEVNGRPLYNGETIRLAPGSTLSVKPLKTGPYEFEPTLALFASDRPGVNLIDAKRIALEPFSQLELRSDGSRVAKAKVEWSGQLPPSPNGNDPVFVCWLNGHLKFVRSGEVLQTVLGDQLILEGIWGGSKREIINLKGFVAIPWDNNGQDMGWEIIMDPDNFLGHYAMKSDKPEAVRFKVVRETPGKRSASFLVDIEPRKVRALRLKDGNGQELLIPWTSGKSYSLPEGSYVLEEAWSNGAMDKLVATANDVPLNVGGSFEIKPSEKTEVMVRQATTFDTLGEMTFTSSRIAQGDMTPRIN